MTWYNTTMKEGHGPTTGDTCSSRTARRTPHPTDDLDNSIPRARRAVKPRKGAGATTAAAQSRPPTAIAWNVYIDIIGIGISLKPIL